MNWDAAFFRRNALFWPIARAASRLETSASWPNATALTEALSPPPPLVFERALSKPRRSRATPQPSERYDARITLAHAVPTRERSWHDLLNAFVWATFPRAKRALHARQHRIISAQLGEDLRVPGARTKEQDAVAMLDEGGVVIVYCGNESTDDTSWRDRSESEVDERVGSRRARTVVFGHAVYESCVAQSHGWVRALALFLPFDGTLSDDAAVLRAVDTGVEALLLREGPIGRDDFGSTVVRW